ncbi:hypothetical protein MNBD_GAMMA26-2382 [hydrothermal vent metagenome]|uniref:Uncharacterized protein n=1 Tax=hydrothermal vent metagenome TaxID=652676 RepID=A0A3B1BW48_9ZZZZ
MKIIAAGVMGMMVFFLYPKAKHWAENSPKAEKGDWNAALLPLAAVVAFVMLLIMMVRG